VRSLCGGGGGGGGGGNHVIGGNLIPLLSLDPLFYAVRCLPLRAGLLLEFGMGSGRTASCIAVYANGGLDSLSRDDAGDDDAVGDGGGVGGSADADAVGCGDGADAAENVGCSGDEDSVHKRTKTATAAAFTATSTAATSSPSPPRSRSSDAAASPPVWRPVHAFDSFNGLPEAWRPGFGVGAFTRNGQPPAAEHIHPAINVVTGLFADSLSPFLAAHVGRIALLHVDCDLFSSTQTVLDLCESRIDDDTIVVFDELLNYTGFEEVGSATEKRTRSFAATFVAAPIQARSLAGLTIEI
jgi:hypothetical protein